MAATSFLRAICFVAILFPASAWAFTSDDGNFKFDFPEKPAYQIVQLGGGEGKVQAKDADSNRVQHQFTLNQPNGTYMVSYQDNPNLAGADAKQIDAALILGRDSLIRTFGGETKRDESIKLAKTHPGRELIVTIPAARGVAHCRLFMVGTRLYQILVIGTPEFVQSDESMASLQSFAIVKN